SPDRSEQPESEAAEKARQNRRPRKSMSHAMLPPCSGPRGGAWPNTISSSTSPVQGTRDPASHMDERYKDAASGAPYLHRYAARSPTRREGVRHPPAMPS